MRWILPVALVATVLLPGCQKSSAPNTKAPTKRVFGAPITKRIEIPMRDGTITVATLQLPAADGQFATVLCRTPYGREGFMPHGLPPQYAIVCQDVRGKGDSQGKWEPFVNEKKDGYDTIQWIAKQPWSNGKVAMVGASYMAYAQWAAVAENPPALKAVVSDSTPPDPYQNIPYENGCFLLATSLWYAGIIDPSGAGGSGPADLYKTVPITGVDQAVSKKSNPLFQKWLTMEKPDDWKEADTMDSLRQSKVAALFLSGWQDGNHIGTYLRWTARPGFPDQYIIIGPWGHGAPIDDTAGRIEYADQSSSSVREFRDNFLAKYLEDRPMPIASELHGAVKVTGMPYWLKVRSWPSILNQNNDFFFDLDEKGRGVLTHTASKTRKEAKYTYDPKHINIVPALQKDPLADMSPAPLVEADLPYGKLLFRTDPLSEPMTISGASTVSLRFSSTAVDTDFFFQLFDEFEGKFTPVGQAGKFRCRYFVTDGGALLTPGKGYRTEIQTWDTGYQVAPEHRLTLMISSDRFPVYALNPNTGEPIATATKSVPATQSIYVGLAQSRITIPEIRFRRGGGGMSGGFGRPLAQ